MQDDQHKTEAIEHDWGEGESSCIWILYVRKYFELQMN